MSKIKQIQGMLGIEKLLVGFEPGDVVFGRFTLERHLGGTAVGVVWSAYDSELERRVSLKLYPTVVFCDEAGLRHLRRVIDAVRRVRLSGVATIYELVEDEQWVAVVCELVDGTSVATELQMIRPEGIELAEMKSIVEQVVETMQAVHDDYKIVHGKLSPGNIMRTPDGRVKIMDLGIARVLSDCVQRATRVEGAMGELPYLSPQQLDGEVPRPSDDIYSFGSTIYECITGKPPFFSGDIIWEIRNGVVPTLEDRRREFGLDSQEIPKVWDKIVAACLNKHTEQRPSSFRELISSKEFAALAGKRLQVAEVKANLQREITSEVRKAVGVKLAPEQKIAVHPEMIESREEDHGKEGTTVAASLPPVYVSRGISPVTKHSDVVSGGGVLPMNGNGHSNGHSLGYRKSKEFKMVDDAAEEVVDKTATEESELIAPAQPSIPHQHDEPTVPKNTMKIGGRETSQPDHDVRPGGLALSRLAAMLAVLLAVAGLGVAAVKFGGVSWLKEKIRPLALADDRTQIGGETSGQATEADNTVSDSIEKALEALQAARSEAATAKGAGEPELTNNPEVPSAPDDKMAEVAKGDLQPAKLEGESLGSTSEVSSFPSGSALVAQTSAAEATVSDRVMSEVDRASASKVADATNSLSGKIEQMFGAEIENLSDEEKAALEALRKAEAARIEAQRQLEVARLRKQAEARLAEFERKIEAARDVAKLKEAAMNQAVAALEEIQSEHQKVLGNVREMMGNSQQLQAQLADVERTTTSVQQRIADLEVKLEAERKAYADATLQMQEIKSKAEASMAEITKIREMSAHFDSRIEEANSKVEAAKSELDAATQALAEQEAKLESMRRQIQQGNYNVEHPSDGATSGVISAPAKSDSATSDPLGTNTIMESVQGTAVTGSPPSDAFVNSLGMRFVPIGDVLFSIWETRRSDFEEFVSESRHQTVANWKNPGFEQQSNHPVVNVTWDDAIAFCNWLTERDRARGMISANQYYRLPTDLEWSLAAGLPRERGQTPEVRDMDITSLFPWGGEWPPPAGAGNYTGEESGSDVAIRGYSDGYKWTSPVGAFQANAAGLYDMGGNVWEWCMDWWNADEKQKVLRGASWYNGGLKLSLLASCRICSSPAATTDNYGFRLVLAPVGS